MTHIPVLLKEAIEILDPKPGEFIIDGTVGAGGHAAEILKKIKPSGTLLGIDWNKTAIEKLEMRIKSASWRRELRIEKGKIILIHGNYADLPKILKEKKLPKANGLILDLGFSTEELESADWRTGRGFSFLKDEILDMRYSLENELTAAEIINSFPENDLADIFYKYGEERFSRKIAKKIIEERKKERILTTSRLTGIIRSAVPRSYERGRIHPATRVFQALRIYVNDELGNLTRLLENLTDVLKSVGKAAIISFHSLEDRIVKKYFKQMEKEKKGKILTKKPIVASKEEITLNPRSRSAKLRAIEIN